MYSTTVALDITRTFLFENLTVTEKALFHYIELSYYLQSSILNKIFQFLWEYFRSNFRHDFNEVSTSAYSLCQKITDLVYKPEITDLVYKEKLFESAADLKKKEYQLEILPWVESLDDTFILFEKPI